MPNNQAIAVHNPETGEIVTEAEMTRLLERDRMALERRDALEPSDFAAAMAFAKLMVDSGMYLDRDGRPPTIGSVILRVMTGRQLGLSAALSMQLVYEVYGNTGIAAKLKRALVRRHPECERFEMVESDAAHCVWVVKRRGNTEKKFEFRIEDARAAGLVKKDSNWEKWARRMLQARASSEAADVEFPEACMGLETIEEVEDRLGSSGGPGASTAAPSQLAPAAPARDWEATTALRKSEIVALVESGDAGKAKLAREIFSAFEQLSPPPDRVAELKQAYNETLAAVKARTGKASPKPAAAAHGQEPRSSAKAEYVPPHLRGDSYEGPEQP